MRINNDLLKFNEIEKNIKDIYTSLDTQNKHQDDFQYFANKRFSEIDASILKLIQNVSEVTKQTTSENKDKAQTVSHLSAIKDTEIIQTANPASFDQIAKVNKEIENMKKLNREFNEKLERYTRSISQNENLITELTEKFEESQIKGNKFENDCYEKFQNTNDNLNERIGEIERKLIDKEIAEKEGGDTIASLTEQFVKVHDSIKNLTNIASSKANKEDIDKITKMLGTELDKLNIKINDQNKNYEGKIKNALQLNSTMLTNLNLNQQNNSKNNQNSNGESDVKLKSMLKDFISKDLPLKIKEQINLENEILKDISDQIIENKNNIEFLNQTHINFKNKYDDQYIINLTQGRMTTIFNRIDDLQEKNKKLENLAAEKFREIEGNNIIIEEDLYDFTNFGITNPQIEKEKVHILNPTNNSNLNKKSETLNKQESSSSNLAGHISLKEILKLSLIVLKKNFEKIENVNDRQNNMNNDILNKVKKDLGQESGKILDEFRTDLKVSIGKIEDQLREKVDRFSLDEFGRRVDTKLNTEINKKIDRTDLKKNNNIINKKIDTLENKISKTLVDTLIDLQMDEMPLIIKKSMNGEKCASCNQFMQDPKGRVGSPYLAGNTTSYHLPQEEEMRHFSTQTKFKLRNIQDNSNKYGTGSYSRFLNNVDNVNEELYGGNNIKNSKNSYLPEISHTTKNSNKKNFNNTLYNNNTYSSLNSTFMPTNGNLVITNSNNNNSNLGKIRIDELAEKQFNTLINEELEKKIINPENLIKTANKIYDNAEKRSAANLIK